MTSLESRKASLTVIEGAVCKDRTATHGNPEDNFADIAAFWSIWISKRFGIHVQLDALDVAEMCALLKTARKLSNLTVLDHWDDGAGYNVCGAGIIRQRQASTKVDEDPKQGPESPKLASPLQPEFLKRIVEDAFRTVPVRVPPSPEPYPPTDAKEWFRWARTRSSDGKTSPTP